MRIPRISRVCSAFVSGLLILFVGCSNPSSTTLNLLTLKVTPATVSVGGAVSLQATAHFSDGTTQDVTSSTQWTLSNPSLARLGSGVLTAMAPGALTVQGAYVMVVPAGQSSSSASSVAQPLSSSAQVTITAAGTTTTTPTITWSTPAPIQYGAALSSAVLNAQASVPGKFAYSPAVGTVLKAGTQTLTAVFTPSDTKAYSAASATVQLTVNQADPVITWAPVPAITQGTALSSAQLNATASVPGTFTYSPSVGAIPPVGTQPLTVTFTPTDLTDYKPFTGYNSITVGAPGGHTPSISWRTPAAISYGTALSSEQLDATANVAGTFTYTPAAGTVLKAGTQRLTAVFTPTDASDYSSARATVQIAVNQVNPVVNWPRPAAITQGTALSAAQLDATANVPGTFSYSPGAGTVPAVGTLAMTATFTPTDATDYGSVTAHNALTVNAANTSKTAPTISWHTPAAISYGAALSGTQLNATANVAGTFAYTPAAGTVLKAGTQTLSVAFTPTDTTTYSSGTATVQLTVNQVTPTLTWAPLAAITQGTALGAAQLDATANVPGVFAYNPAAGNVPAAGTLQLTATFTPTDTTDYAVSTAKNTLVVNSSSKPTSPTIPTNATYPGNACPIAAGASQATIQSTLNSCGSGNTAVFAAGTYNVSSSLNWPCGVSISSASAPSFGTSQSAVIKWTGSGAAFGYPSSCTVTGVVFQGIEVTASPAAVPGGSAIYLGNGGGTGPTIQYNYFHGVQGDGTVNYSSAYSEIYIDGNGSTSGVMWTGINILWNVLGTTGGGDCANYMNTFYYGGTNYNNAGGFCAGVNLHSSTTNLLLANNRIQNLEEGFKLQENPCGCQGTGGNQYMQVNGNILYNDFSGIHRIAIEAQQTPDTTLNVNYNDWHDATNPGWGSWMFSLPQYDEAGYSYSNINTNMSYNVFVSNVPAATLNGNAGQYVPGNEFWGTGSATYNLFQGNSDDCGVQFGFGNAPWTISNNTYQGSGQAVCNEENQNTNPNPTQSGNTSSGTIAALTSVAPTISPASGTFSGSQTVTFSNPGTNRDVNTGIWYTTDGSTPVPGSGTAQFILSGGTITVSSAATVKAVGMWGQYNQPTAYASGYGYVPSAVVSASYTPAAAAARPSAKVRSTVAGNATVAATETGAVAGAALASVAITPAQATVAIGSTTQLKAIATFSDGSTKDVTTAFAWTSSDTRTITATSSGLLSGLASGKATIAGSYQGRQASVPAVSAIGPVDWSGPIVISEAGTYSGNWRSTDSKTPAVTIATTAPVVIENAHISSVAGLIKTSVAGGDVTVRNSVGAAVNPGVKGQANGVFVDASFPARLDVENNYVENAGGGVLVHGYSGNRDGRQTIVIRANRARNLNGLLSDGNGGYLPGAGSNHSVSRFIELDKVQAVPGVDVGWNEVINYPGRSLVADNIAVRSSSGTPNQPLEIHDTYIQGAYPYAAQANYDGGGIKTEGSPNDSAQEAPAFNNIHDNQVVGTVNYGIAFTAGHDNIAANNRVISSGMLADGTRLAAQHVGMANGDGNGGNTYNNSMHDNLIGWACWNSSCKDQSFPASPGDYSANSVVASQPITPDMENNEYQLWLNKTATAGIAVGPAF